MCCIEISQLKGKQKVLFSNHNYVWFVWNPPNGELEIFGGFHYFNATPQTGSGPNF